MQARSDGISATTVVRTRVDLGATVARPGGASLRSAWGCLASLGTGAPRFARHAAYRLGSNCRAANGRWAAGGRRTCWRPVWCPRRIALTKRSKQQMERCRNASAFGRNFRDYGSTYSSRSRCDRRSAWGCLASLGTGCNTVWVPCTREYRSILS